MSTSTPEPGLRLCLGCSEKHRSCCVVFVPRLGYCTVSSPPGTSAHGEAAKCTLLFTSAGSWCCSLAGLRGCAGPWELSSRQQNFSPFSPSLVPPGGARSGCSEAQELLLSWSCQGRAGATYPTPTLRNRAAEKVSLQAEGIARESGEIVDQIIPLQEYFLTNTKHWSDLQSFHCCKH